MNEFKKPLTIFASTIVAIFLLSFINKSGVSNSIITMRTTEALNDSWDNSLSIVYEDGKIEKIKLESLKPKDLSKNLPLITKTLNEISSKGYKLISSSEGGGDGNIRTTYTFLKE